MDIYIYRLTYSYISVVFKKLNYKFSTYSYEFSENSIKNKNTHTFNPFLLVHKRQNRTFQKNIS